MRALFYVATLAVTILTGLLPRPSACAQSATASYQALNWDKEITLPPNAYRSARPIDLNGDFTVKTQPGTLIEGANFQARSGVQHWHVEGTQFRRVRLTVKRNGSGHGIDSVFEDFDFSKDDNWYNFWWSTRWRFDNCVFTHKLLRGDLPPLDYAVHASRCTFYETKLPNIGFKEDPAKYLGKEDMGFVKCRFVDCEVPQSFLAATVDCVFEDCHFQAKGSLRWPKETTAIKVHDYYAGTGSQPPSFVNGPLTVEFEEAPRDGEFGSTVPHTQSGGRVTMTDQHLSGQFVQLGSTSKKASEIVDVPTEAATGSPAPAPVANAPAPTPVARPVATPAVAVEVHGVEDLMHALPGNLELRVGGKPNAAGVAAANAFLAAKFAGHVVAMRLTPSGLQAVSAPGNAYQADGRWQDVLYHGAAIPACAVAMFPKANAAALAKVPPKSEFPLGGTVAKAEFTIRGTALSFVLYVAQARVLDALAVLNPDAPTAGSGAGAGDDTQVVGAWTVFLHWNADHWEQTFNADHTAFSRGEQIGTWEIKDGRFEIHLAGGVDSYALPVRDGVMYGSNKDGGRLTLARPDLPTPPEWQALLVGTWEFNNPESDGFHATYRLNADHTFTEGDRLAGHWQTLGNAVVFAWEGHDDWHDMFDLPGKDGMLSGVNGFNHRLTMNHAGMAAATKTAAGSPGGTFFGDKRAPRGTP